MRKGVNPAIGEPRILFYSTQPDIGTKIMLLLRRLSNDTQTSDGSVVPIFDLQTRTVKLRS